MTRADRKLMFGILLMANCAVGIGLALAHVPSSHLPTGLTGLFSALIALLAMAAFRKHYPSSEG